MSTPLTYGRVAPDNGDRGSVFFPALRANAVLDDAHTHNGINSAPIPSTSVASTVQVVPLAGSGAGTATAFVSAGTDSYSSTVTMPTGVTFDDFAMEFIITASPDAADVGQRFFPTVTKVSASVYTLYINKSGLTLRAVYR